MNIGERIKKLRKTLDLTQQKFGEKLGIKGNTVAQYELRRSNPVDSVISLICREFNVNEEWLRYGEGEMFNPAPTDVLDQLSEKYRLSNADCVMIEKFVNLRPDVRKNIYDYFREVVNALVYDDINPHGIASPECDPDKSLEELETEYKKSRSVSAQKMEPSALNITAGTNIERSKGVHKKASGK